MTRSEEAFRKEIQQQQDPPEQIVGDGKIHRYGPKKALWYVIFPDGIPAGAFGDWRKPDQQHKWCAKGTSEMTNAEHAAHRERMERIRREHDDERQRQHEKAKAEAEHTWSSAQPADPGHGYLIRKGIQPHNLRQTQRDGLDVLGRPRADPDWRAGVAEELALFSQTVINHNKADPNDRKTGRQSSNRHRRQ